MKDKFSERLRKILNEKKIKASQLAELTGLSESLISQYLNDKIEPKNDKLLIISEALNVDLLSLMGIDKQYDEYKQVANKDNKTLFSTPQEAFEYIIKQPTVAMYGGYDLEKMSDEELIEFANDLADMLSIISKKYNK
ncbi:MAG: helix-turn-helix transcriptional regulator [Longicatena sp.]|uniref:helix-turn-helix domain-containing protein n=1 Tax=Anaerorhabdus sp. TaxID=1872524 RepID=UPI002FCC65AB